MGKPWFPPKPDTATPVSANLVPGDPVPGDPLARRIADHIPLVPRLAWQLHRRAPGMTDLDELVQTGLVALVEAAGAWEDRGFAFATYAQTRVRGAMIDFLRRDATLSRAAIVRKREVEAVRIRLMGQYLRMPHDAEMAEALGLTAAEWRAVQHSIEPVAMEPLDLFTPTDAAALVDPAEAAESAMIRAEGADLLARAIATLPERQALVLQLYFVEELSLDEIGTMLGVGAARVCQIKKAALDQLREDMLRNSED